MTREDGAHLGDRITQEEKELLYSLINEHKGIDCELGYLKAELKFELAKERLAAYREDREIRELQRETELKEEIKRVQELWDDKIGVIADLVEDLGLLGVSL